MNKDIKKELEEIAPSLSKMENNIPFSTPGDAYFDAFPAMLQDKIHARKQPSVFAGIGAFLVRQRITAFATAIIIIVFSAFLVVKNGTNTPVAHPELASNATATQDDGAGIYEFLIENVDEEADEEITTSKTNPASLANSDNSLRDFLIENIDDSNANDEL